MRRRPPFVSGLPDRDKPGRNLVAGALPTDGNAWLARIRAQAAADAEMLAPLTRQRFDGVERTPADPAASAAKETYDAVVALVDGINADRVLQLRIAALLARRGSPPRVPTD